jgi:hydrogenase maturation protein HypF
MGRLFDAIASLLDVRHTVEYEAQAAVELEALAAGDVAWPATVEWSGEKVIIDPGNWVRLAMTSRDPAQASYAFHAGLAAAVVDAAVLARERYDVGHVGLTGGVFSNVLLTELCLDGLRAAGFRVLVHRRVPPNDGGLALGQVVVAGARLEDPAPRVTSG